MNAQLKPEPREYWIIVNQHGETPIIRTTAAYAEAQRVVFDHEYPSSAPHAVIRLVEA